jgi:thioredoxin reductase (NADPH)
MHHVTLAIIGSGPAGYTAAIYAARARLNPTLFAGYQSGGQLMWTTDIENFPGFPDGVPGPQLMQNMRAQSEKFGTVIRDEFVTAVDFSARPFKLWNNLPSGVLPSIFEQGTPEVLGELRAQIMQEEPAVTADAVIIATGATSVMLGIPGEMELLGRGVSTCAVCDAAFFREKDTFVIGGGDSAMEDAMALTKFAKSVTLIHRRDSFKASKIMQERVLSHEKVAVLWNTTVKEVVGEQKVSSITVVTDGIEKTLPADGVFLAIGHRPMNRIFESEVAVDHHGYVVTRKSLSAEGVAAAAAAMSPENLVLYPSMSSVEGVFAAGDGVDVRYKQAITAAGMGCEAALDAERWLERQ